MTAGDHAIAAVLERAWQAPFYRRRWGRPPSVTGMAALSSLPVITPEEWATAIRRNPAQVLGGAPALWTLITCAGRDAWFPLAHEDVPVASAQAAAALRRAGVRDGDRLLAVLPGAPSSWNALSYLVIESDLEAEFLVVSMDTLKFRPDLAAFPFAQKPPVLLAPHAAAAELVSVAGPLPPARLRLFYGDAREAGPGVAVEGAGDGGALNLIALPGCLAPISCCPFGAWHLDPAALLAEILLEGPAAGKPAGRAGSAVRELADAPAGATGTLVLTTFTRAAPLVRFATGLRVRAPGLHGCACGDPNPRMLLGAT